MCICQHMFGYMHMCMYVCLYVCVHFCIHPCIHVCIYILYMRTSAWGVVPPMSRVSVSVYVCVCVRANDVRVHACIYPCHRPPPRSWPCPYILGVRPRALRSNPQRLPTPTPNGLLPKGAFSLPRHGTEGVSSGTDCAAGLYARPALRWWMKLPANSRRVSPHSRRIEGIALVDEAA